MGKYDFGSRVRDFEGDEGYIVGKKKGKRQVNFDADGFHDTWLDKSDLTFVDAPALVGKIVEGGTYLSRSGETFGPMMRNGTPSFPWSCGGKTWSDDGSFFVGERDDDLVVVLSEPEKAAAKTLTIQAGKFYRSRDGRKVGPMELNRGHGTWPWHAEDYLNFCRDDGTVHYGDGAEHPDDLIAEWTDEPSAPPITKFKVGDKVEFTDACPSCWWFGPRKKYTNGVVSDCGYSEIYKYRVHTPNGDAYVDDEHIRLTPSTTKFKVGDRVRFNTKAPGHSAQHTDEVLTVISASPNGDVDLKYPSGIQQVTTPESLSLVTETPAAESHIVCRMFNGNPRPNGKPYVHATLAAAETEAQRLSDLHGGEFAVYSRGETKTVDAGPVPLGFSAREARASLSDVESLSNAFIWDSTKHGDTFWRSQYDANYLTLKGRAILTKWLAEAEAQTSLEAT